MTNGPMILMIIGAFLLYTSGMIATGSLLTKSDIVKACTENQRYIIGQNIITCEVE